MRRIALAMALLGCAPAIVWTSRTSDGRASVLVTEEGARFRWTSGGWSRVYDTIAFDRLRESAVGIVAPARRDGAWWMIEGPSERGPFASIGEVVVAGSHLAYVVETSDGFHVVTGARVGAAFEAITEGPILDADHGSVAYVARRADGEHAVHDEAQGPACELVALATLGAKGRMLAYVDRRSDDRLFVDHAFVATYERVIELGVAREEPHWGAIVGVGDATALVRDAATVAITRFATHLRISDDGAHVACLSATDDGAAIDVVVDGAHVAHHRRIEGDLLAFVPGEGRVVFVFQDGQGTQVALGDVESERYEALEGPTLAPHRAGWIGRRADRSDVVIEGALVASEEWAGSLTLASRGDGYAYVARTHGERFVVTSRGRWPVPRLFVDSLVLDAEGRHWAALVPDPSAHRLDVWIDGAPHGRLDDHALGGAIVLETERTPSEVVRAWVASELVRAVQ